MKKPQNNFDRKKEKLFQGITIKSILERTAKGIVIMDTFAQKFLKIYDRKIMNGEITFSQSGIKKNDFTRLCIDKSFVMERENVEFVCDRMNVTPEERDELLKYTEK